jgi:hypothetical protein
MHKRVEHRKVLERKLGILDRSNETKFQTKKIDQEKLDISRLAETDLTIHSRSSFHISENSNSNRDFEIVEMKNFKKNDYDSSSDEDIKTEFNEKKSDAESEYVSDYVSDYEAEGDVAF